MGLVLEDPLAGGDDVARERHAGLVHHVEVDERRSRGGAGVARCLACGDARDERAVAARVAFAAGARVTERLPHEHAVPERGVVRLDPRVDDCDGRHGRPGRRPRRPELGEPVGARPELGRRVAGGVHRRVQSDDEARHVPELLDPVRGDLRGDHAELLELLLDRAEGVDRLFRELGAGLGLDHDFEFLAVRLTRGLKDPGRDVRGLVVARAGGQRQRQRDGGGRDNAESAASQRAVLAPAVPGPPQGRRAVLAAAVPGPPERARAASVRRDPVRASHQPLPPSAPRSRRRSQRPESGVGSHSGPPPDGGVAAPRPQVPSDEGSGRGAGCLRRRGPRRTLEPR